MTGWNPFGSSPGTNMFGLPTPMASANSTINALGLPGPTGAGAGDMSFMQRLNMLAGNLGMGGNAPGGQQTSPGAMAQRLFAAGTPSPSPANSSLAAMLSRFGGPGTAPGAMPGMGGPAVGGPPGSTPGGQGAPPMPPPARPMPGPGVPGAAQNPFAAAMQAAGTGAAQGQNPGMLAAALGGNALQQGNMTNLWHQLLQRIQMQQGGGGSWMA